jgi:AcrR family transcriptional regulator
VARNYSDISSFPAEQDISEEGEAECTKRRILAAALREFSAKGISGARVDTIAEQARANKRMLYYYFGSKEGLFRAVLNQRLTEKIPDPPTPDPPPHPGPPPSLEALDDRMAAAPDYVRLLMWEALERGDCVQVEAETSRRQAYERWVEQVTAEQTAGLLPADIDPTQFVAAQLALALFPYAFPQLARLIDSTPDQPPETSIGRRRELLQWLSQRMSKI